jgi:hypothetical protein
LPGSVEVAYEARSLRAMLGTCGWAGASVVTAFGCGRDVPSR